MSTILITGANKGLGRALTTKYLTRNNLTIIAAVRAPQSPDSLSLSTLPTAPGTRLILIKIDARSDTDAKDAVAFLETQNISSIDLVIANAAIFDTNAFKPVAEVSTAQLTEHFDINAVGPVRLFQATLPLLRGSSNARFVLISSLMGSIKGIGDMSLSVAAYGASKAAANFLVRKIHDENSGVAVLAVHPGSIKTAAGNDAARAFGFPEAFVEVQDSVDAIVEKLDSLSRENGSGEFWGLDGGVIEW